MNFFVPKTNSKNVIYFSFIMIALNTEVLFLKMNYDLFD